MHLPASIALVPVKGDYTGVSVAYVFGKTPDVNPILAQDGADHEAPMRLGMRDVLPALKQLHSAPHGSHILFDRRSGMSIVC